jgi:hypothetical protein
LISWSGSLLGVLPHHTHHTEPEKFHPQPLIVEKKEKEKRTELLENILEVSTVVKKGGFEKHSVPI